MTGQDDLLDIKQAAALLNVSETSLRRWTNSGRLRSMRVGLRRERRFRREDLLALLESVPSVAPARGTPAAPPDGAVADDHELPLGTHLCGLFSSDEGRARLASAFLLDGLRRGSSCFLVAPPAIRDEIVSEMSDTRPLVGVDVDAGMLTLSEYAKSGEAQLESFENRLSSATSEGVREFRVVGHLHEFHQRIGSAAVVEYEAGWEKRIARRFPVVTMCQYDARLFSGLELFEALKGHPDCLRFSVDHWMA